MKVLDYDYRHSAVLWHFIFCQGHLGLLLLVGAFKMGNFLIEENQTQFI